MQRQMNKNLMLFLIGFFCLFFAFDCSAEMELNGQFTQGGLIYGKATPGQQVFFHKRQIGLTEEGQFIFGLGRDASIDQKLTVMTESGEKEIHQVEIQPRQYQIERINGISKKMMQPSAKNLKRIKKEAGLVSEARKQSSQLDHFREQFIWPVAGRISGVYGSQRIFNGEPRRPHFGIDIAAPKGTRIVAPAGGKVTLAHPGMFFSGATLIIDHGYGLSSSFLHLDSILVKTGDQVIQGQKIATVGASGRVTGPHLDWRVNWFEQRLDPALLVSDMPGG
jgi:murein DD-endopeptidase MepM/ murein hydrolase activator NlpD